MVAGHIGDKPTYISAHSRWQGMLTFGKECSLLFSIARWYKLPSSAHCGCDSQSQFFLKPKKKPPTQAAKYTFGDWAAKGLSLSATWADNVSNYLSTKCYKVMLCDPKDLGGMRRSWCSNWQIHNEYIRRIYIYILYLSTICIRYSCTHVVCVHLQVANADIYKLQTKGYETWSKNIGGQQSAKLSTIVSKSLRAIVPCINEVLPGYKSVAKSDDHLPKFGN